MTERCSGFYSGRCMLHHGHRGACGPGLVDDQLLREAFEAGAKWVAQVDDPGRTKWSMDRGFADFRESLVGSVSDSSQAIKEKNDHGAGLIHPVASPLEETEPRSDIERKLADTKLRLAATERALQRLYSIFDCYAIPQFPHHATKARIQRMYRAWNVPGADESLELIGSGTQVVGEASGRVGQERVAQKTESSNCHDLSSPGPSET